MTENNQEDIDREQDSIEVGGEIVADNNPENDTYSVQISDEPTYGWMLEVLRNGKAWSSGFPFHQGQSFRMGVAKWKIVIACLDIVRAFYESGGIQPKEPILKEALGDLNMSRISEFEVGRGARTIEQPVLRFVDNVREFQFGVRKAGAILRLHKEIEDFVVERG